MDPRGFTVNVLPRETQIRIVAALVEGCSIRSTERMLDVHRDTIMLLGLAIGERCAKLHNRLFRDLNVSVLELDEAWSFVAKKQKRAGTADREIGDQYLYIGMAANQKAILSYSVGKRTSETTNAFAADLRSRVLGRPQITSDGFQPYVEAVELAFGEEVDFAQLMKVYAGDDRPQAEHRYSPGHLRSIERKVVQGAPDMSKVSTSYVERQNLTLRMQMRRFTRLTNAFSKKLRNHKATVALHVAWYNLCRVHESLRVTPAMALGVTDHIWSVGELIDRSMTLDMTPVTPAPEPPPTFPAPTTTYTLRAPGGSGAIKRGGLRLLLGGKW